MHSHVPSNKGVGNKMMGYGGWVTTDGGSMEVTTDDGVWGEVATDAGDMGIIPPICKATQNSETFENNIQVLPSVYRIAVPNRSGSRWRPTSLKSTRCYFYETATGKTTVLKIVRKDSYLSMTL